MTALAEGGETETPSRSGLARRIVWRVLREPLVHFMVIGALIFGGISLVRSFERPTVEIDAQDLSQLVEYWEMQAQRPPTPDELKALLQERVDEELLSREALRLGMDKGDLIIRRRLAQKMSFASEDLGANAEPTDAQLHAYFDRNQAHYAAPARVALRHVFFSADRGVEQARAAATAALALAKAGKEVSGDPSLLPLTYAEASLADLSRDYGAAFVDDAATAPFGEWRGPIQSPFGFHLVRVESRSRSTPLAFESVRSRVRDDDLAEQRKAANEAFLKTLRGKYQVKVAGMKP